MRAATWIVALALSAGPGLAAEDGEQTSAGGSVEWVFSDDLDSLGTMWVHVPVTLGPKTGLFGRLHTLTAIEQSIDSFTFDVRQVDYTAEIGARFGSPERPSWSVFAGQLGTRIVDDDGHASVRYVAGGWETARYGPRDGSGLVGAFPRWRGGVALGPVFAESDVEAGFMARGFLHYRRPAGPVEVGFDLEVDGLGSFSDGGGFDADVRFGPRVGFAFPGNRLGAQRFDLFLHYLSSRHPLRLDVDAVVVGLDIVDVGGFGRRGERDPDTPEYVWGTIAAGGGDNALAGLLRIHARSPGFLGDWRVVLDVEGNALTAEDTNDLFYRYFLGVETTWRAYAVGGYFYHRSNHTISAPNDEVTSINVLEAGIETSRWNRPPPPDSIGERGRLDWRARLGWLVDSSFGEDRRFHVRGGIRWVAPWRAGRWHPFAEGRLEYGDVEGYQASLGMVHAFGFDLRIEYAYDNQWFRADDDVVLAMARYGF